VHKRVTAPLRSSMRAVAVVAVLLIVTATPATAQTVEVDPGAVTFGLLGPVGLVAVALGILGMTAGVLRQRRKARTASAVVEQAAADGVLVEDPTRPVLGPVERTLV
jgi:hypothetical protein